MYIKLEDSLLRKCVFCNLEYRAYTKLEKTRIKAICSKKCRIESYLEESREKFKLRHEYRRTVVSCLSCYKVMSVIKIKRPFCSSACRLDNIKRLTKGELKAKNKARDVKSDIGSYNRKWNAILINQPCLKCGYDKHVELAHIKAVSSFSDNATLGEINHPSNIIPLCPNCHWEFDNLLKEIEKPY